MNKKIFTLFLCLICMARGSLVSADVLDYTAVLDACAAENAAPQISETDNGAGAAVKVAAREDTLFLTVKNAVIRAVPGEQGQELCRVLLGAKLKRVGVCDNGWSKVEYEEIGKDKVTGYIENALLSDQEQLLKFTDTVTVSVDSDVLDFPGRKDGEIVGEVLELDELTRTGTVDGVWSRILFEDGEGAEQVGYIPTSSLEGYGESAQTALTDTMDAELNTGTLHENTGGDVSVFAKAEDAIADEDTTMSMVSGIQVGNPIAVSSDASLLPLGVFRITHYCPCSICCGPWANGITSTGVIATTNHTIAVDPSQIPYGSRVVINGQVYVAEDCGGAIKTNCIDIYVASHEEGEAKGVYYTDVYLIQ